MSSGKASRLPRPTGTSTSAQSLSSPVSRLPVKRPRRTSFSSTDSTLLVGGAAPSETAKVNDHQTTGKAKVAVTQPATSRSATSRLPPASPISAEIDRASRVGDNIKCRLATNVNASVISVPPSTSTTTTDTTAGASLQAPPNERPTSGEGSSTRSPLFAPTTSVATLLSLLLEDVHDLPPASTSISTDPPYSMRSTP